MQGDATRNGRGYGLWAQHLRAPLHLRVRSKGTLARIFPCKTKKCVGPSGFIHISGSPMSLKSVFTPQLGGRLTGKSCISWNLHDHRAGLRVGIASV
jgi:hypothetical protein